MRVSSSPSPSPSKLIPFISQRVQQDTQTLARFVNESPHTKLFLSCVAALLISVSPMTMPSSAFAEVPVATPSSPIFDDVKVIPKGNIQLFDKACASIEESTGYKVHFLIVRSLPFGESPTDYANEVASSWNLGSKDILFVASVKLARAGVYVGKDAQTVLTDDIAISVGEQTFGLPAGEERYGTAILDVSNRLIPILNGESDPGAPNMQAKEAGQNFKNKQETKNDRDKYIKVVGGVLLISVLAPLIQTYWYVRDD